MHIVRKLIKSNDLVANARASGSRVSLALALWVVDFTVKAQRHHEEVAAAAASSASSQQ